MKRIFLVLSLILLLASAFHAIAQIPRTLSYQGVLTDAEGNPRPNGDYTFTFRLYDSASGGTALWSEQKTLPVQNGLFSTALGDQMPFDASIKFDRQYWLGIQVGDESELTPRIALTSVGYSFSAMRADTASVSVASLTDTMWKQSGTNIYRLNGKVGIGTMNPRERLSIAGNLEFRSTDDQFNHLADLKTTVVDASGSANLGIWTRQVGDQYERLTVTHDGKVGIGTTTPTERLSIAGNLEFKSSDGNFNHVADLKTTVEETGSASLGIWTRHIGDQYERLTITHNGDIGIGTTNPTSKLEVIGTTTTKVLAITGGSDLAEPFEMTEPEALPKGALVVIDPDNPGKLKLARAAYDKRVAGVISGAGGINPGLTLTQEGVLEGGQNVALSGRVYALATDANGAIEPGDLLTTSDIPGHAMKATDFMLSQGAVIGKAMSALAEGEGLVLVLVNLQ